MRLTSLLGAALLLVAGQVSAAPADVDFIRNKDAACLDCHKEAEHGMQGAHGMATNPNSQAPVTCTNCHGLPAPNHREGVKDVMRFGEDTGAHPYSKTEQNSVCLSCHTPSDLRQVFWAHDVHTTKLLCTNCHSLHQPTEPMVGLSEGKKIGLCVDCHQKQQQKLPQPTASELKAQVAPAPAAPVANKEAVNKEVK
ncbi:MAG: cytochrome c nitrite reductase pentaheme subunit [Aeromonas sp.]